MDVRETSRHVRVRLGGAVLADSKQARLLSETGLPNRLYLPPEDVRSEMLRPSDTRTVCPYKGTASYWSLHHGDQILQDVAWSYQNPLEDAAKVRGHLCFDHEALVVETTIQGLIVP